MSKSKFSFGGKSSEAFYLTVEKLPVITAPEKKYSTISVPGRNGELHIEENAFRDYIQPYECWFRGPDAKAPDVAHAIKEWLLGSRGVQILKDSYDPDHFRKATYLGPMDMERLLNEYGRCIIQFSCNPQSFLNIGEQKIGFTTAGTLRNPTPFTALPLITVYGSGAGVLNVGKQRVEIKELADVITLDCESMNAYRKIGDGATQNMNNKISAPVFPELTEGENIISWTGSVERIEIIPRWWTL